MNRMIDANINRICEGLRVIEDYLRFELNDIKYIDRLKIIRHFLRENLCINLENQLINYRNSQNDTGKKYSSIETNRKTYLDLLKANFFRVEEGLRVLEETSKIENCMKKATTIIKAFRFEIYQIEKEIFLCLNKKINLGLYFILDISNIKFTKIKKITRQLIKSGITTLELKGNSINNINFYKNAKIFQNICMDNNIPVIIYNKIEIALALDCDGIHIDSDYLPPNIIKKIYKKTIGYTVKNIKNINTAIKEKIDYILFKQKESPINEQYLNNYANKIPIAVKLSDNDTNKLHLKDIDNFAVFSDKEHS